MTSDQQTCRAKNCAAVIPKTMLMCRPHWSMVPMHLKARVLDAYAAWKRGADTLVEGRRTIAALRAAQAACVEAVGFVRVG